MWVISKSTVILLSLTIFPVALKAEQAWSPKTLAAGWVFVEGAEVASGEFDAALVKALKDAGLDVDEAASASALKSRLNPGDAFSPGPLKQLVSAGAQVAVLAKAEITEPQKMIEGGWRSVICKLQVRIIRLATGEAAASLAETVVGDDLYINVAIDKAVAKAVSKASKKIHNLVTEAMKAQAPLVAEFLAPYTAAAADSLKQDLSSLAGVLEARLSKAGNRSVALEVRIGDEKAQFCEALAEKLAGTYAPAGGCGEKILFKPAKTIEAAVFLFENRTKDKEAEYLSEAAAVFIEAGLLNIPLAEIVRPSSGRYFTESDHGARSLKKEGKADIACRGKIEKTKNSFKFTADFAEVQSNRIITSFQSEAPSEAQVSKALHDLTMQVETRLVEMLLADKSFSRTPETAALLQRAKNSAGGADFPVAGGSVKTMPLFARLADRYQTAPPVRFKLKNAANDPVYGVKAGSATPVDLAAGQEIESAFCPASLPRSDRTSAFQAELTVNYAFGGVEYSFTRTVPLFMFGEQYSDISQVESLLPFMTPDAPAVEGVAAAIKPPDRKDVPAAILKAAAALAAVKALGIKITPDAPGTLKKIRPPCRTIQEGSGTRTDVAVLAASIFKAAGLKFGFVTAEAGLLPALDTGLTHSSSHHASFLEERLVRSGNRLFIPLDASAGGLNDAWEAALRAMKAAGGNVAVTLVSRSNEALLGKGGGEDCKAAAPTVSADAAADADRFVAARNASFEVALKSLKKVLDADRHDADAMNRAGILYARAGRYGDAEKQFRTALREAPEDPRSANNLANAQFLLGRFEEAKESYDKAISRKKKADKLYANFGIFWWIRGNSKEALENFKVSVSKGGHAYFKSSGIQKGAGKQSSGAEAVMRSDLRKLATMALASGEAGSVELGVKGLGKEEKELGEGKAASAFLTTVLFWWE